MARFDANKAKDVLVAIRAGASTEVACHHAEVPLDDVRDWLRGDTPAKVQFRKDVDKARADLELLAIGMVRRDVGDSTTAAQWVAEHTAREIEFERLRELTT